MTIGLVAHDFIATDSRLSFAEQDEPLTVGKIFKREGGGIFTTAGDGRRTNHFERAMRRGREPAALEVLEDEKFEGVVLMPDRSIIYYDADYAPYPVGDGFVLVGGPVQVARSWYRHAPAGEPLEKAVLALHRSIEVDASCGYPIAVAFLDGRCILIDQADTVTEVARRRHTRRSRK